MSLFDIILQLSIISTLGLMIQSAPINTMITKRSTLMYTEKNLTIPEKRLYCAARDLYDATGNLRKAQYSLTRSDFPEIDIDIKNEVVDKLYSLSSYRCKNYANVMILKHQLQDHIFNPNMTDLDLTTEHVGNIPIILTSLQTMADSFNDFELSIVNKRCVKFTPAQYQIMYYAKYNRKDSLLKLLKDNFEGWYLRFDARRKQLNA